MRKRVTDSKFYKVYLEKILGVGTALVFLLIVGIYALIEVRTAMADKSLKGRGYENDPYVISSAEDFLEFARGCNEKDRDYADAYIVLKRDIALPAENNNIQVGSALNGIYFCGVFNGQGHSISGLDIKNEDAYTGLFSELHGTILNLAVLDSRTEGTNCGGICGVIYESGKIYNCYSDALVSGEKAGSICAVNRGAVENCVGNNELCGEIIDKGTCINSYLSSEKRSNDLNANIAKLPLACSLSSWTEKDNKTCFSGELIPVVSEVKIKIPAFGKKEIAASRKLSDGKWIVVVPKDCISKESYKATAVLSNGKQKDFTAFANEDSEIITEDGIRCTVSFVPSESDDALFIDVSPSQGGLSTVNLKKENEAIARLLQYSNGEKLSEFERVSFSGRGNSSFEAVKKSYSIKSEKKISLFGMDKAEGYNLISGYRDDSLLSYIITRNIHNDLSLPYAHDFRVINVYINGSYQGVYFLTEKMEISKNAFDLEDLFKKTQDCNEEDIKTLRRIDEDGNGYEAKRVYYDIKNEPYDITGGYLLEVNNSDFQLDKSRFVSDKGIVLSSKADRYLSKGECDYISSFWQDYENAVTSSDGRNEKGIYYADYIDLESFADQFILLELTMDPSLHNSIYFWKDSDSSGDGKLHACWNWDVEHSFLGNNNPDEEFLMNEKYQDEYFSWAFSHADFRAALYREWTEKFYPLLLSLDVEEIENEYADIMKANDVLWGTDFEKKTDEVNAFLEKRIKYLNSYFENIE